MCTDKPIEHLLSNHSFEDNDINEKGVEPKNIENPTEQSTITKQLVELPPFSFSNQTEIVKSVSDTSLVSENNTNINHDNPEQNTIDTGQLEDDNILQQGLLPPSTVQSTTSLKEVKKSKQKKTKGPKIDLFGDTKPAPLQQEPYITYIWNNATGFIVDGKKVHVNVEQLDEQKKLGDGASGIVYLVDIKTPRHMRMAVKCIALKKEDDHSPAETELKTWNTIVPIKCPYIVDYYGAMMNNDTSELCIALEYMDASGKSFYKAMHDLQNKITIKQRECIVRCIIHDIASALFTLEKLGLVHRDIKPDNMLVKTICGTFKLCDFGLCGDVEKLKSSDKRLVGTSAYNPSKPSMNPIHDDMWRFGITLLEILINEHPCHGLSSLSRCIQFEEGWKPTFPAGTSNDLIQLIRHLLEKDPEQRPASFGDILKIPSIANVRGKRSKTELDLIHRIIRSLEKT